MKAVIIIHGYLSSVDDFGTLPEELIPFYDEVIKIALPGHGEGESLNNFTLDNMKVLLDETLPKLCERFDKVDVIGFSLGGAVAKYLAQSVSIHKLVLIAPAVKYLQNPVLTERLNYIFQRTTYVGLIFKDRPFQKMMPKAFVETVRDLYEHDKTGLKFALKSVKTKFRPKNGITFMKVIAYINRKKNPIECPMLIVWGTLDELVPYKAVEYCYKKCTNPQKEIVAVPGVGHLMLRAQHMGPVKERVIAFLQG
ncbi:MAG: alpha/beta hydrolase [Bacilli bacterium]|jgi:esterase/lipase|nr:alpha/beta hydrolase [Bacilli bacterium]HHU24937.1 alpha/beta hydrolase [Acholeplasmataceae bacterium]